MSLAFRPAQYSDTWFITSTWLESFQGSREAGLILAEDWFAVMKPQILKLLAYPSVEVTVAYNPENDDLKSRDYGWIAHEKFADGPLILYLYVKKPARGIGLGKRLLKEVTDGPILYACKTKDGEEWLRRHNISARWTPRAARRRR